MKQYVVVRSLLSLSGRLPVLLFALILGGCSGSVKLKTETEIPEPLVQEIPIKVGVHFDEAFRNYVYEESTEDRPKWRIDNRESRIALFEKLLSTMFREVQIVDNISSADDRNIDAVLSPQVEEMQLALPKETYSEFYEAWVKYNIRLYSPDGELVTEWAVTGYGKATKGFFDSRSGGLNNAINVALRDIGAKIALNFPQAAPVKQWLAGRVQCDETAGSTC